MSDVRARLIKCFAAAFPQLTDAEIVRATPESVSAWDSLASVTLISVLEEEFGVEIEPDDLERLVSFEKVMDYLEQEKSLH
jgi:acyl carrier protein